VQVFLHVHPVMSQNPAKGLTVFFLFVLFVRLGGATESALLVNEPARHQATGLAATSCSGKCRDVA
jgi:hypothetical protein